MIYRWTIELRVNTDEIEATPENSDTWLTVATRDMESMPAPAVEYAEAKLSTEIEFEQGDPSSWELASSGEAKP